MNTWNSIKQQLTATDPYPQPASTDAADKRCPACSKAYSGTLVVCKHDGTLLIPNRHNSFDRDFTSFAERLGDSRYKLQGYIGEGDLTLVYNGFDLETRTPVIFKLLKSKLLGDFKTVKRFNANLDSTKLKHDKIASILDFGSVPNHNEHVPQLYIVMERLDGMSMKSLMVRCGNLPPNVVTSAIIQACDALHHAAQQGFLHKDLKPSNIYLSFPDNDLQTKVVDFGLAERMFRNLEWTELARTRTGSIYGNPSYVSPDAFDGTPPTVQSEIYSLGCVLYHALKGMPPFEGSNDFDTLMKHRDAVPKPFAPELKVPADLEAIVMKCLKKQPKDRYISFEELGNALRATCLAEAH